MRKFFAMGIFGFISPASHFTHAIIGVMVRILAIRHTIFMRCIFCLSVFGSIFIEPLSAASRTWQGDSGTSWGTAGNWSALPGAGDTAVFTNAVGGTAPTVDAPATVDRISYVAGAASFTIGGASTLSLNNSAADGIINSSANTMTISAPLKLINNLNFDSNSGRVIITGGVDLNGNTLTLQNGTAATGSGMHILSVISDSAGGGTLNQATDTGMSYLEAINTYAGATTVTIGSMLLGSDSALGTTAGNTVVSSGASVGFTNNINYATKEEIVIRGVGASGYGALYNEAGNNTFAGSITNSAAATIGSKSGSLTLSGTITNAGFLLTFTNKASSSVTVSGVISGSGALRKLGAGTLTLSGINTYTGATTNGDGTISISADSGLGTAPGAATAGFLVFTNGATLQSTATFTLNANRGIAINGNGTIDVASGTTLTYNGIMAGASGNDLTKTSAGTLVLGGVNTYSGKTIINGGTVSIAADSGLGTSPGAAVADQITLDNGTLKTTASFTLNANRGITLNAGSGTADVAAGTTLTYNGIVAGSGALIKTSAGTLTLGGANTFTGNITNSAGNINVQNASALGGAGARTLQVNGGSVIFSVGYTNTSLNATLNGGAISNNNVDISLGTLTLSANSTINLYKDGIVKTNRFNDTAFTSGTVLTINNWTGTGGKSGTDDRLFFTSNAGGNSFLMYNIQFTGYNPGAVRLSTGEIVPIPEPSTFAGAFLLVALIARTAISVRCKSASGNCSHS